MRFQGFVGPAYQLSSVTADCQRCVNLYPEIDELRTAKAGEIGMLTNTPGLLRLATIGNGPIRGLHTGSDGILYVVSGNTVYTVNSSWTATSVGTMLTSTGQVDIADNGTALVIVDGNYGYACYLGGTSFAQIMDAAFLGSDRVAFQDGYFIFNKPNSGQFYISGLNAVTFDLLDFATAEGAPDNIVALLSDHRELWLFGDRSVEVFFNSGNPDFPFERIQGAFIEHGCAATWSAQKLNNTTFWLGGDGRGDGVVWAAQGYQPQRISNHAIEYEFQSYATISDAVAWTYQQNGHGFYVLTFPTAQKTWVYDTSTGQWHERAFLNNGQSESHRGICHAFAYGVHVVGDREDGRIYHLDLDTYTDDGAPIKRIRSSPHAVDGLKRLFFSSFQLDMQPGVGLTTGQGSSPIFNLRWSDDGGFTWSNEHAGTPGAVGATKTRTIWRRLGNSRQRVWEISMSDPVRVAIVGAEVGVMGGLS